MKLRAAKKSIIALSLLGISSFAMAADFADGFEAATAQDYKKAASIWQTLAEKGDASAQFNLGMLYHSGIAGYMNEEEAVKWYQKAASNGNYRAQEYLTVGYREGWFGLKKDDAKADFWQAKLDQQG